MLDRIDALEARVRDLEALTVALREARAKEQAAQAEAQAEAEAKAAPQPDHSSGEPAPYDPPARRK